ncbi:MAG: hypothetical protein WCT39_01700 [Candidatus Margulisiibacteriota bacterium]
MKKALLLLVAILLVCSAVYAAPKTQTIPPSSSDSIAPGTLSIGSWANWAVLGYKFTNEISGGFGTWFTNTAGTSYGLLLKADYNLARMGAVQPSVGLSYNTSSTGASGTVGLNYGLNTMIQNNLSVGFDIFVATLTSAAGTSTTTVLPGAVIKAALYL